MNRTHLTVTLRSAGSEQGAAADDDGPLGRVLDSYTLKAKKQGQGGVGVGGRRARGVRVGVEEALL